MEKSARNVLGKKKKKPKLIYSQSCGGENLLKYAHHPDAIVENINKVDYVNKNKFYEK